MAAAPLYGPDQLIEDVFKLHGRVIAYDLLLRSFYAELALQQPDPRAWLFELSEQIIGGMDASRNRPANDHDRVIWEQAEAELHRFVGNIAKRLVAIGHIAPEAPDEPA